MSENIVDQLSDILCEIAARNGKPDTIVLAPHDYRDFNKTLAARAGVTLTATTTRFMDVAVLQGALFEQSRVDWHVSTNNRQNHRWFLMDGDQVVPQAPYPGAAIRR